MLTKIKPYALAITELPSHLALIAACSLAEAHEAGCFVPILTGSYAICPEAVTELSDLDFIILGDDAAISRLRLIGWEHCGNYSADNRMVALRKGLVNLLVTDEPSFYGDFCQATRVAAKLRLARKQDRIALFQAILYKNG